MIFWISFLFMGMLPATSNRWMIGTNNNSSNNNNNPPPSTNPTQNEEQLQTLLQTTTRPTAIFPYDWRRPLPELSHSLHTFCQTTYPDTPVQIIAHSLGGLLTYAAMRRHPEKYAPGAVLVGVPFGTGIQYFENLHRGYYTELERCRQFTPVDQFTFGSHWSFFPVDG